VAASAPKLLSVSVDDDVGNAKQETESKQTDPSAASIEMAAPQAKSSIRMGK
jgi:hypothetical protein